MRYKFILERSDTGYSAFEEKMPIYTTGGTLYDVKMNALAAVNLFEEEYDQRTFRPHGYRVVHRLQTVFRIL